MIKKYLILFFITFLLSACGYSSLYKDLDNKKLNLKIVEINGDKELNNFILSNLNKYLDKEGEQIEIIINTNYSKSVVSRDSKGSISNYQLIASSVFNVQINDQSKIISMSESFIMKNRPADTAPNIINPINAPSLKPPMVIDTPTIIQKDMIPYFGVDFIYFTDVIFRIE